MVLGFKTGPRNFVEGQKTVLESGANMCEIWFDVTEVDQYQDMFRWLADHDIQVALHHWGLVDGQYKTNLMTADDSIRQETLRQMKYTIDIAAELKAVYVNVHPGAQAVERLNFTTNVQSLAEDMVFTDQVVAEELLLAAGRELDIYAKEKSVLLTVETLPGRENTEYQASRVEIYDAGSAGLSAIQKLAAQGNYIANDITHTAGQISKETSDVVVTWKRLLDFTKKLAPMTKLVHINTVEPPYNGTDSHGGITDRDFAHERFPTKKQLKELLAIYSGRHDVFVVPEPSEDLQGNFEALKALNVLRRVP